MSPNMIHAGLKFNQIPGIAEIEVDVRNLPGTPEPEMQERIRRRIADNHGIELDYAQRPLLRANAGREQHRRQPGHPTRGAALHSIPAPMPRGRSTQDAGL